LSILAIAARLILIDQPFIDHWSWRQSDVAAIARNYSANGFNFARPQIDWAGDQPGYVGTEFPILPFLAALSYKVFGLHEWIGRIQAVILFALSLPCFFLLVRKTFGELAAVWALFFYCFAPLGIMASRCFMPDMPSLALSIAGLYFFQRWTSDERATTAFILSALCISLSILIKATSVLIAVPLAGLAFQRFRFSAFQSFKLWIFAAVALLPSALWYWHAYQISQQFYPYHFFGAGGVKIMSLASYSEIARQIFVSELTPLLFLLGAVGVWQRRSTSSARPWHLWLAAMILFIIIVGHGNRHSWYRLPLIQIFAAFGGAACALFAAKISNRAIKVGATVLLVAAFALPAFLCARKLYEPTAAPMRDAGLVLKRIAPRNALLVAADNGDPTIFYYADRRGWHFLEKDGIYDGEPCDSAQAIVDLEQLRKRGASFLVFSSDTAWWLEYYRELGQYVASNSRLVEATREFRIYQFNSRSSE
jgi:4-amino-4-deoxy-L-arabinose transferase-like glycosyltransferase